MIPVTCDGQPAAAVTDQIRAVAKERLRARVGVISEDELAAINDGLRQIINTG
jgi:mRNA-degrading endonuclease toxin of MazEF toxin-antitoxin module